MAIIVFVVNLFINIMMSIVFANSSFSMADLMPAVNHISVRIYTVIAALASSGGWILPITFMFTVFRGLTRHLHFLMEKFRLDELAAQNRLSVRLVTKLGKPDNLSIGGETSSVANLVSALDDFMPILQGYNNVVHLLITASVVFHLGAVVFMSIAILTTATEAGAASITLIMPLLFWLFVSAVMLLLLLFFGSSVDAAVDTLCKEVMSSWSLRSQSAQSQDAFMVDLLMRKVDRGLFALNCLGIRITRGLLVRIISLLVSYTIVFMNIIARTG
jgi:hypothetical protein